MFAATILSQAGTRLGLHELLVSGNHLDCDQKEWNRRVVDDNWPVEHPDRVDSDEIQRNTSLPVFASCSGLAPTQSLRKRVRGRYGQRSQGLFSLNHFHLESRP